MTTCRGLYSSVTGSISIRKALWAVGAVEGRHEPGQGRREVTDLKDGCGRATSHWFRQVSEFPCDVSPDASPMKNGGASEPTMENRLNAT